MKQNRRDFLRFSLAGSSMVALTGAIPNFLGRTAAQARPAQQAGARDTILVVVQLSGGNVVSPRQPERTGAAGPDRRAGARPFHRHARRLSAAPASFQRPRSPAPA